MSDAKKLQAEDIKNEVKRIKKLPKEEQEAQMGALHDRIKTEIDVYYDLINTMNTSEQNSEYLRIHKCISAHKMKWELELNYYLRSRRKAWGKSAESKQAARNKLLYNKTKSNTAHVSGLPLPEKAEVDIWWQDKELIFASSATEFSLPVERIMGMGTTREMSADNMLGISFYLTIEYKKENEMKAIVLCGRWKIDFKVLIEYFDEIKGARKMPRQEL